MNTTKHTPGPWEVITKKSEYYGHKHAGFDARHPRIITDKGLAIANVVPWHGVEFAANARLIAAAPELLAALERLLDHTTAANKDYDATTVARAAIAKAKGQKTP